ncbi:hypothetical protein BpHYR1_004626 [Brachionus plicatilis]|uniref:RNA-directed DNA polymerase from mobile element jockey-like n=1 Tax=Brachionus plicatilis TaxID=10195 RepID=A0A3M7S787_BRAPC|nr:hypothetical protein BpHYR1_004626 [Brachionus plicatilis]
MSGADTFNKFKNGYNAFRSTILNLKLFLSHFSMCYVQGATIGDLLVGHLRKLVLLNRGNIKPSLFLMEIATIFINIQSYDLHKIFYQYLLHLDQLKEFFSKSGYINRPHRSRLTARNLEATTLLELDSRAVSSGLIPLFSPLIIWVFLIKNFQIRFPMRVVDCIDTCFKWKKFNNS